MIANRHSQAALLKSQIDQIDHRLKELEKSASSLRVAMVHLRERMEAALPPPPPPPLLVPKEGYMVRWNKPPNDASPTKTRVHAKLHARPTAAFAGGSGLKRTCRGHPAMSAFPPVEGKADLSSFRPG